MDVCAFGTILYWMVGLGKLLRECHFERRPVAQMKIFLPRQPPPDRTAANFLTFISILFTFSLLMNQVLAVFAAIAASQATVQVASSCVLLFLILFGGFIVPPNVIAGFYVWIYWWNPFAWAYRALLVQEFQSDSWDDGDGILRTTGFILPNDEPFQMEWVWYWFAYMIPSYLFYVVLTAYGLSISGGSGATSSGNEHTFASTDDDDKAEKVNIPFLPATMTFEDICYDVKSSTGGDTLRLLSNVNGILKSGRMCALMGSSGAG